MMTKVGIPQLCFSLLSMDSWKHIYGKPSPQLYFPLPIRAYLMICLPPQIVTLHHQCQREKPTKHVVNTNISKELPCGGGSLRLKKKDPGFCKAATPPGLLEAHAVRPQIQVVPAKFKMILIPLSRPVLPQERHCASNVEH